MDDQMVQILAFVQKHFNVGHNEWINYDDLKGLSATKSMPNINPMKIMARIKQARYIFKKEKK